MMIKYKKLLATFIIFTQTCYFSQTAVASNNLEHRSNHKHTLTTKDSYIYEKPKITNNRHVPIFIAAIITTAAIIFSNNRGGDRTRSNGGSEPPF